MQTPVSLFPAFRCLSRWLLLVMLTTVLAPGFGWEAAGGMLPSAQAASAGFAASAEFAEFPDSHHDHHQHGATPVAERHAHVASTDLGNCNGSDMPPCDDLAHHCCPGHVLSHLSAALLAAPSFLLPISQNIAVDRSNRQFSSRVPEGLERPPRAVFA